VTPTPLTWVDYAEAAGALAAVLGLVGGVVLAISYGRKATATVAAELHDADGQHLLAVRPSICAVGVFRLRFVGPQGAQVRVNEILRTGGSLVDGLRFDAEAVFGETFVDGGETLMTTVLFELGEPIPELVGWRVSFGVTVERRLVQSSGWTWADQTFVPRPDG